MPEPEDVLRVESIAKRFGPVTALRDVNLHLGKGEVLGLLGDNGAGKSTLIKIISGFQKPDEGRILVRGEEVELKSVDHARSIGIDCVYQYLALVNELDVVHNIFLRREVVKRPLPFLAQRFDYSMEAANAFAVVLDESGPDVAKAFHDLLFDNQPSESGPFPDDDQLVDPEVGKCGEVIVFSRRAREKETSQRMASVF